MGAKNDISQNQGSDFHPFQTALGQDLGPAG